MNKRTTRPFLIHCYAFSPVVIAGVACMLVSLGCGVANVSRFEPSSRHQTSDTGSIEDSASVAISYIDDLDVYSVDNATSRILNQLELWLDEADTRDDWKPDPLITSLPQRYSGLLSPKSLSRRRFEPYDVLMLREAVWMRNVARRVVAGEHVDPMVQRWVSATSSTLDESGVEQLRVATMLFDWTVRNIALDNSETQSKSAPHPRTAPRDYAWEGLLFGHADAHLRARIFVLLLRQLGTDAVTLARDASSSETSAEVVAGVMIGDDLLLFDAGLGLPILGADGIATWKQLVDDPDLLRQMDIDQASVYSPFGSPLSEVVAFVDATPGYLSRRMKLLESSLPGRDRVVLSVSPDTISMRLANMGIGSTRIDAAPLEAMFHKQAEATKAAEQKDTTSYFADYFAREEAPFNLYPALMRGRFQHLRGQYDDTEDQTGARSHYLRSRIPDKEIHDPAQSTWMLSEFKEKYGVDMGEGPVLTNAKGMLVRMKEASSFWLGTIAYQLGDIDVAIDYFQNRTIAPNPDGFWAPAARYYLARCHEAKGLRDDDPDAIDKAIALLRDSGPSPQALGNRVRARLLEAMK